MRYKLFEIEADDIDEIQAKECYSVGELGCSKTLIQLSARNPDSLAVGFGVGVGELHGIAGAYRQWEHSAQLWAVFGAQTTSYPIALAKLCEAMIQYAVKKQDLKRISLNVRADYSCGNRFARFLNFDLEGTMKRFLPDGGDANLYARLF